MDHDMKITRFLRRGELGDDVPTVGDAIDGGGDILDEICAMDSLGDVVFECEDGKTYVLTFEAVVSEVNPQYFKDLLEEDSEDKWETTPADEYFKTRVAARRSHSLSSGTTDDEAYHGNFRVIRWERRFCPATHRLDTPSGRRLQPHLRFHASGCAPLQHTG